MESDNLEDDAPIFFLSHAMEDHHFAARVRFNLARHGIRSWLAEGDLHEGSNLFEAVEAALNRCDALMILLSSFSITSAWVYTEVLTALKSDKRTVALIDASDAQICTLLHGWMTENQKNLRGETHGNWLDSAEGISASSKVLERYMRVASPTRLLKFRENLNFTLKSSTMEGFVAFYPTVPQALKKNGALWNGFDAAIEYLGIQKL